MAKFLTLALSFAITLQLVLSSAAVRPGIQVRLTDNGLKYFEGIALKLLEQRLAKITIPTIKGDAHTKVGSIYYELSNIAIKSFSIASSSLKTVAGTGLQLKANDINSSMSGNWHYHEVNWPHISDNGTFDLDASDISFTVGVKLGADSKGHPNISAAGCSCSVRNVKIHFHGGCSWLYNLFDKLIDAKIKDTIQSVVCQKASDAINTEGEKALQSFPTKKDIDKYSLMNFALVESPKFTATFMDLFLKGEFMSVSHPEEEAPFSPAPLPSSTDSTQMAYVWLTDYVVNTAGLVYEKAGRLAKNITFANLPKNFSFPLNTKTFKYLIPKLYKKHPNIPIEIDLYATEPPHLESDTTGVSVTIVGNTAFYVVPFKGYKVFCFTLGLVIRGTAQVAVNEGKVTVHSTFVQVKATVVKSAIGDISASIRLLDKFLRVFVDNIIIDEINEYGKKGFPLPVIDGIELLNTKVTSGKNFNLISTDFKYTPASSERAVFHRKKKHALGKFRKYITIV